MLPERVAIDEEQDAPEAAGLDQAVAEADAGPRFTGARGHGEQQLALARLERALDGQDRRALIVAVDVRHRLDFELGVRFVFVLLQEIDKTVGRVPTR